MLADLLLLVSVDGQRWPSVLTEVLGDVVGDTLRAHEDEDLGVFLRDLLEVLAKLRPLLKVTYDLNDLLDVVVRGELHGADVDLDEVLQEVLHDTPMSTPSHNYVNAQKTYVGELLYVLRPSGGEHECLPVGTNLANDLADLGLETHVKHAIRLVHDQVRHTAEVSLARLEHIDETTGSGDDNLDTALEVTNLGSFRRTAVDGSVPDARVGAVEASIRIQYR